MATESHVQRHLKAAREKIETIGARAVLTRAGRPTAPAREQAAETVEEVRSILGHLAWVEAAVNAMPQPKPKPAEAASEAAAKPAPFSPRDAVFTSIMAQLFGGPCGDPNCEACRPKATPGQTTEAVTGRR